MKFNLLLILVCCLVLNPVKIKASVSELEKAEKFYQQGNYQKTIEILSNYPEQNLPLLQEYLGVSYSKIGRKNEALIAWQKAYDLYLEQNNIERATVSLLSLAELYLDLGQPQKAISLIEQWQYPLPDYVNGIIGNAYLTAYQYEKAVNYYQKAVNSHLDEQQKLANYNNLAESLAKLSQKYLQLAQFSTLISEKNRLLDQSHKAQLEAEQIRAIALSLGENNSTFAGIKTQINNFNKIPPQTIETINNQINQLANNQEKIELLLDLSKLFPREDLLKQAEKIAISTGNDLSLAVIYAKLGSFYEQEKQEQLALEYTQLAQLKISPFLNYNYLYQWQWQEGRIRASLGQNEAAKLAYFNALDSINQIRAEIANAGNDVEFNFQQDIKPIYQELIELLLENPRQENLAKVLEIQDNLQLAELENFFREPCFYPENPQLAQWQTDNNIVIFVPIILENSFQIIVSLPNQKYLSIKQEIKATELEQKIKKWQSDLTNINEKKYLETGNFFYQLILAPFAQTLAEIEPNLIVFVNEGLLRNVPMSALYSAKKEKFLIEEYPLTVSLARNFLIPNQPRRESALTFGLSEPRPPINQPLPLVLEEIKLVSQTLDSLPVLNQDFTRANLSNYLQDKQPEILHLATHGEFTGLIENSFIQAYDQVISPQELEKLLTRSPRLNLLTLSACQTSLGNERSVLGLAGIAVRIGIPSVMGSLWSINDDLSVDFVADFYGNYQKGLSKAEALRQAQIKQIKNLSHPLNWSAFILLGN